jgi:hypothetical protein
MLHLVLVSGNSAAGRGHTAIYGFVNTRRANNREPGKTSRKRLLNVIASKAVVARAPKKKQMLKTLISRA